MLHFCVIAIPTLLPFFSTSFTIRTGKPAFLNQQSKNEVKSFFNILFATLMKSETSAHLFLMKSETKVKKTVSANQIVKHFDNESSF